MSNYYVPTRSILAADLFDGRLAKYGIVEEFVDDLPCEDDELARALLSPCAAMAPSKCPEPVDPAWLSYYTGLVGITVYIRRDTGTVREFRRSSLEFAEALFAEFNGCELVDHYDWYPEEIFHYPEALARYSAAMDTLVGTDFTADQLLAAIAEALEPWNPEPDENQPDPASFDVDRALDEAS